MKIYYRFSFNNMADHKGNTRQSPNRPQWFDKWKCLANFLNVFSSHDITIVADSIDDSTWNRLNSLNLKTERTNFGSNAGSFLYSLEKSIKLPEDTKVYFVEDDYLHHEGADIILEQGLELSAYVSLYDHPDKYWNENASQLCKLIMSEDCHWRTTGSTTMTFGSYSKFLKEDYLIFKKWCGGNDKWTHDFQLFSELSVKRGLITPIPGYSTTLDNWVISKMVDWEAVQNRTSQL